MCPHLPESLWEYPRRCHSPCKFHLSLGQTTICCQSNAYFTIFTFPMCKLTRANNMLNTSEMFSDRILNAVPDCSSFVPPNIITSHCIWRCYETLDQMGLSNQRQLEEPQEEEAARSPVLKWRLMEGYEISITTYQTYHMSTKLTLKRVVIWSSHSSLESKRYARWLKWGASSISSVVCCVPGQLIWINGVSWGCALTWRHVAWVGTTSNLKQGSLSLTRQKQQFKCWLGVEGCWNENFCTVQLVQQLHSCFLKTCWDLSSPTSKFSPDMHVSLWSSNLTSFCKLLPGKSLWVSALEEWQNR